LEAITEKFGVAEQECSRLSSEKGNFISKVILIIFMTEMFLNAHFRTVYREKKIILMKELYTNIIIQIDKTENDNNKRLDKKSRIQNKE
jgi:hypothetical protein